jgi:hypothetical protein
MTLNELAGLGFRTEMIALDKFQPAAVRFWAPPMSVSLVPVVHFLFLGHDWEQPRHPITHHQHVPDNGREILLGMLLPGRHTPPMCWSKSVSQSLWTFASSNERTGSIEQDRASRQGRHQEVFA